MQYPVPCVAGLHLVLRRIGILRCTAYQLVMVPVPQLALQATTLPDPATAVSNSAFGLPVASRLLRFYSL